MQFDRANTFGNRLQEGNTYVGQLFEVNQKGQMASRTIAVHVTYNIYPGPNKLNGDGTADFQQFCIEPNRPIWDSCRVFQQFA